MSTIFYKYRIINDHLIDSLQNNYIYFSRPAELNDPFDGKIEIDYAATDLEIEEWGIKHGLKNTELQKLRNDIDSGKFHETMESGKRELEDRFFIFCLSDVWNESMMWAHYSNSNTGLCVEYKAIYENNTFLLELSLENENNYMFAKGINCYKCALLDVKYTKTKNEPYNPFRMNLDVVKNAFYFKEPKWNYEREYRSILINNTKKSFNQKIVHPKNMIKEIIFGENTSDRSIGDICSIMKQYYSHQIHFYKLLPDSAKMSFKRILLK